MQKEYQNFDVMNLMYYNVIHKVKEFIMVVSIRLNEEDEKLFRSYAQNNHMSLSELFRSAVLEKIEDEYDLEIYRQSLKEYNENPVSYSHEEVRKMLGIE
ncbi:MAG: DUF6290 family protein [Erysipelotrichaceae bacterium]|nr:DUF6290 family protein [Erysipelotrichaceae bacterium]